MPRGQTLGEYQEVTSTGALLSQMSDGRKLLFANFYSCCMREDP